MKTYTVNFNGNVLAEIKVGFESIEVVRAMDGWGRSISVDDIEIEEVSEE